MVTASLPTLVCWPLRRCYALVLSVPGLPWRRKWFLGGRSARCLSYWFYVCVIAVIIFVLSISGLLGIPFWEEYWSYSPVPIFHPPSVTFVCPFSSTNSSQPFQPIALDMFPEENWASKAYPTELRVLVMVETEFSPLGRDIIYILDALKVPFIISVPSRGMPQLTNLNSTGKYAVIIFENLYRYINMDSWNRQLLDKYCREYRAGLIMFMRSRPDTFYRHAKVKGFPLLVSDNVSVRDLAIGNGPSPFFYITKPGGMLPGALGRDDYVAFYPQHATYESILSASVNEEKTKEDQAEEIDEDRGNRTSWKKEYTFRGTIVVRDRGLLDGVKRIIFGQDLSALWLHRMLFVDSLMLLTRRRIRLPLERYLQIDIDDIFVGGMGYRMTRKDVQALLDAQDRFSQLVPGFQFNLGFSGKFLHRGSRWENDGEDFLLDHVNKFRWFPHMWRHNKAHLIPSTKALEELMGLNLQFAQKHGIPLKWSYAVAPHHSGVYPVHEPLYEAWKTVFGIHATSTEEYPHLKPASQRRGFVHMGIMVLPRLTCGLYTHTVDAARYPHGWRALKRRIFGGDLFEAFVYNPFLVFMTHSTNYARDRLALYAFESVLRFVQCWTNLKVRSLTPLELAKRYFDMYPEERIPVWGNPCLDKRHMQIWARNGSCDRFPDALILGPQKTGTTALYFFLKLHPSVGTNYPSDRTFEEVQFFSGKSYANGISWYLNFFPRFNSTTIEDGLNSTLPDSDDDGVSPDGREKKLFLFEKSATYFDSVLAPQRAKALLPKAKLIAIITSPIQRAYSWYQHMRAHVDSLALRYSFEEVLQATKASPRNLRNLKTKCLNPGLYAQHIERWLEHFPAKQLLLVDGDILKKNPMAVMDSVQDFLELEPRIDYGAVITYDRRKGFFCQLLSQNRTKCLGRSKGRHYDPIDSTSRDYLRHFYRLHNVALERLLRRLGYDIPRWLKDELSDDQ